MKRRIYGVVAGVLSLAGASTLVCFPGYAEAGAKISIIEQVEDGSGGYKPWEDITGAMPGESYSVIPEVQNNGSTAAWVGMCISGSVVDATGAAMKLPAKSFEIGIDESWVLDSEIMLEVAGAELADCYKYGSMVEAGGVTEPIFTEVTLSSGIGNAYKNSVFSLHLEAFTIGELPSGLPDEGASESPDASSDGMTGGSSGGASDKTSGGTSGGVSSGDTSGGVSGGTSGGVMREPSTNVLTVQEPFAKSSRILSGLGVAAIIVLVIHFVAAIYRKRQKGRKRRKK